jgi:hypothetical protein
MGVIKGFCAKNSPASSSLDAHPFGGGLVPPRPQARSSLWNPNTVKFTHFFTEKPREIIPKFLEFHPKGPENVSWSKCGFSPTASHSL